MKNYKQYKQEVLKNQEVRDAYRKLGPEFEIASALIARRIESGLSQEQLAKRIGTKQSAISRLESGTYNPSVELLRKVADALGLQMVIDFRSKV